MKKKCTKCKESKDIQLFSKRGKSYKHKNYGDGYNSSCRACNNLRKKLWAQKHREKINIKRKEWYQNPEVRKKLLTKSRIYREANKDKVTKKLAKWYSNNVKALTKKGINYRKEMPDAYIKRLIVAWDTSLLPEDIPDIMVKAKREHLKLKRFLKEKQ